MTVLSIIQLSCDGATGYLSALVTKEGLVVKLKLGEKVTFDVPISVTMIDHNEPLDWAVLEVMDRSQPLPETLALVNEADLDEEKSMEVVALHAPVTRFLRAEFTELRVWNSAPSMVQQFDNDRMTVICEGGLHGGGRR